MSGELTANQVGILANRNSRDSLAVAQHYAAKRGVPPDHIIELDLPVEETIAREDYDRLVLQPVRQALDKRRLAARILVLVTTYGIPLRVAPPRLTDQQRRWATDASERLTLARGRLAALELALQRVAPREAPRFPSSPSPEPQTADPDELQLQRVVQEIREAAGRLAPVHEAEKTKEWMTVLAGSTVQFGGLEAFLQNIRPSPPGSDSRSGPAGQAGVDRRWQLVASAVFTMASTGCANARLLHTHVHRPTARVHAMIVLLMATPHRDELMLVR